MAKKDSAYSPRSSCGGDVSHDPLVDAQPAPKGGWATCSGGGGGRPAHGKASAKPAALSCSAAAVAQRALLASTLRRVGGGRRMAGGGTKSTAPSRLSKVSAAAEDVAS